MAPFVEIVGKRRSDFMNFGYSKRIVFRLKDGDTISINQNNDKTIEMKSNGLEVNKISIKSYEIEDIEVS